VRTVDASYEGKLIIAAGLDNDVLIWDLSHFEKHIAGNLHFQLKKFAPELDDSVDRSRLINWAEEVLSR